MNLGVRAECESQLSCLTSLSLVFLIYKIEILVPNTDMLLGLNEICLV